MPLQIYRCPTCKQKLAIYDSMVPGAEVVCANRQCETVLRVISRSPLQVEIVPYEQTFDLDSRPESYG